MIKTIMVATICFLMTAASAMATDTDFSKRALNKLMNKNPRAYSATLPTQRVNTLVAHMMTSSFDTQGKGALSIVENTCIKKLDERGNFCTLLIKSSDMKKEKDGSLRKGDDLVQSHLRIEYRMDDRLYFLLSEVSYEFDM